MFNLLLANSGKIINVMEFATNVVKVVASNTTTVQGNAVVDFMAIANVFCAPLFEALEVIANSACQLLA